MSHYTCVQTQIKDKEAIVKALGRMGFSREKIDISSTPMGMKMYHGGNAVDEHGKQRMADIRLKGHGWGKEEVLDGLCNDMGFCKNSKGSYDLYIDNYTSGRYKNFHDTMTNYYAAELVKQKSKELGYFISQETETEDEITIKITTPY